MPVKGDFKKLANWSALLKSGEAMVEASTQAMAEATISLIAEGFNNEANPYGEAWRPKKVDDGRKVLHGETTRLRNGWHVRRHGRHGFSVRPSTIYAAFHQAGTSRMVARMMVPTKARGMPREWKDTYVDVAQSTFKEAFAVGSKGGRRGGGMSWSKIKRYIQRARALARKAGLAA